MTASIVHVPAPAPAPAPIPLHYAPSDTNNDHNHHNIHNNRDDSVQISSTTIAMPMPIPPQIQKSIKNPNGYRYFIFKKHSNHGKIWISKCLRAEFDLIEASYASLTARTQVVFYWIQREQQAFTAVGTTSIVQTPAALMPMIASIPSQGMLTNKVEMGRALFEYHGEHAWTLVPITYDAAYNKCTQQWEIAHLQSVLESKPDTFIWITKGDMGSLGAEVFLYQHQSQQQLQPQPRDQEQEQEQEQEQSVCSHGDHNNNGDETKNDDSDEIAIAIAIDDHESQTQTETAVNLPILSSFQAFLQHHYDFEAVLENRIFKEPSLFNRIVIQEYIAYPLLYRQKFKFDLRCYVLVASTNPCVMFYHIGKMRMCATEYTHHTLVSNDNLYSHLTNCAVQRSHERYDHSTSSIDGQSMLNDWNAFLQWIYSYAVTNRRALECKFADDWYEGYDGDDDSDDNMIDAMTFENMSDLIDLKCRRLCAQVYDSVCQYFDEDCVRVNQPMQFCFHGVDIFLDERGHFYFLEVNRCASISLIGYQSIRKMTEIMLKEMVLIEHEIRALKLQGIVVDQNTALQSVQTWQKMDLQYYAKKKQKMQTNNKKNMNGGESPMYSSSPLLIQRLDQLIAILDG